MTKEFKYKNFMAVSYDHQHLCWYLKLSASFYYQRTQAKRGTTELTKPERHSLLGRGSRQIAGLIGVNGNDGVTCRILSARKWDIHSMRHNQISPKIMFAFSLKRKYNYYIF